MKRLLILSLFSLFLIFPAGAEGLASQNILNNLKKIHQERLEVFKDLGPYFKNNKKSIEKAYEENPYGSYFYKLNISGLIKALDVLKSDEESFLKEWENKNEDIWGKAYKKYLENSLHHKKSWRKILEFRESYFVLNSNQRDLTLEDFLALIAQFPMSQSTHINEYLKNLLKEDPLFEGSFNYIQLTDFHKEIKNWIFLLNDFNGCSFSIVNSLKNPEEDKRFRNAYPLVYFDENQGQIYFLKSEATAGDELKSKAFKRYMKGHFDEGLFMPGEKSFFPKFYLKKTFCDAIRDIDKKR